MGRGRVEKVFKRKRKKPRGEDVRKTFMTLRAKINSSKRSSFQEKAARDLQLSASMPG